MMNDVYHYFGDDLSASGSGDLQSVGSTIKGQQRILRRLLTNPREELPDGTILPPDYIWQPEYGGGLPRFVGKTLDVPKIRARVRGQILLEDCAAKIPEPQISVSAISNGVNINIQYTDSVSKTIQALSFDVSK
jgi:hypothetical protein